MATNEQAKAFIQQIAPLIQKYAKQYGYKVASPIIAQACCETAYGLSKLSANYHNYFGLKCGSSWKGASVNMKTGEEYTVGTYTTINANFRAYANMEEGVKGYFDFISAKRYANLKDAYTAQQYLEFIKADGYATSSTYVNTNMSIVNKWDLTKYDTFEPVPDEPLTFHPTKEQAAFLQAMLNDHNFHDMDGRALVVDGIAGVRTMFALRAFCEWILGENNGKK